MDLGFLVRVRKTTLVVTLFACLAGLLYAGTATGVAILAGSVWSVANLLWLEALGRVILKGLRGETPAPLDLIAVLGGMPLLLVGGWALLASGLPLGAITIGFSLLYGVIVLKVLGHLLARALSVRAATRVEPADQAMQRPMPTRRTLGVVGWVIFAVLGGGLVLFASANPDEEAPAHAADSAAVHGEHGAAPSGHGDDAHGEGGHGEGEHEGPPHLPTLTGVLHKAFPGVTVLSFLYAWEDLVYSLVAIFLLAGLVHLAFSKPKLVPGRGQALVEMVGEGMHNFMRDTFGANMVKFVPFCGTLFLYILVMNWMGLVPFMKAPTANLNTTFGMAIVVFFFAQFTAIRSQGLGGYLYHLAGEPKNALGWGVALLLFPIEVMGEFIKPLSLAARLFGNVFGEDLLIAVFVGIGAVLMSWQPLPIGFPIHILFVALAIVMGAVQALVFALLAAVYLYMAQPHHEEEHHGAEEHGAQPAHA